MTKKLIHIGAGGFGTVWCREFLARNQSDGTIEIVALVDLDPVALQHGAKLLGLSADRCFTDPRCAFEAADADFCTIVVPPAFHEVYVDMALEKGLDILCEKPIADTFEAARRIAGKVAAAGRRMAVTMSHRFDQDKQTLRSVRDSDLLGNVNLVSCSFASDFRQLNSWGRFRHEMQHPLLIEGAVHHLDIIADLAGGQCTSVFARTWRPSYAEYAGDTDGLVVMDFDNGAKGVYQGTASHAVGLNDWAHEHFRIDGEHGCAILDQREVELFKRVPGHVRQQSSGGRGQKVELIAGEKWANTLLIEQFVAWMDGGAKMQTSVDENLKSLAIVFAAVLSAERGVPVSPGALLA